MPRLTQYRLTRLEASPDPRSQLRTEQVVGRAYPPEVGLSFHLLAPPLDDPEARYREVATSKVTSVTRRTDEPLATYFETRSGSSYKVEVVV